MTGNPASGAPSPTTGCGADRRAGGRGGPLSRLTALAPPLGVAALAAVGCGVVLWADPTAPGNPLPTCPTKAWLGLVCPGCGALRMTYSLLHGDLLAAAHYNAVALVALPLLVWTWVGWTRGRLAGRPVRSWQHHRRAPMAVLAVLVVWWVVRNIPVDPFLALRV
ncbi:Protein of unknown function (DUF2752) [Streptoalloteichus tenebrarius]|uniref:DUF2752 domain-containing protein n=1 Tax=Streptoalloteichus tenebrarius (strain ATCC 17920 / DSM 40477 / JCM 4838 / CBS 697.72 / NBRC 16177 / NCIMB 11028 / NRRL B-12390 / A12253. 1 / ISP 5477) TaxID=1933 RepID=A0ABT1HZB3_STRSD|nr:DUF2752 domain-containing protein [Streptoalloteichus tenebrarius]MCP2260868.1 Protein of unknown function (DUF2752) [Streptoalloteichus tenebrarius]BFF00457.1 hypothetical protein GCM10020241_21320 [Streptoalloteichus tenebrarius]